MNLLPRPPDRIIEIRERRMCRLLARYNISTRVLEIRRRGRTHRIKLDESLLDTPTKVVYTDDVATK